MHPWRAWPSLSYPTRKGEKVRPLIHSSSEHAGASATLVVANGWCCCLRVAKPPGNAPCAPASRSSYQLGWRLPTRGRHGTATPWPRACMHVPRYCLLACVPSCRLHASRAGLREHRHTEATAGKFSRSCRSCVCASGESEAGLSIQAGVFTCCSIRILLWFSSIFTERGSIRFDSIRLC